MQTPFRPDGAPAVTPAPPRRTPRDDGPTVVAPNAPRPPRAPSGRQPASRAGDPFASTRTPPADTIGTAPGGWSRLCWRVRFAAWRALETLVQAIVLRGAVAGRGAPVEAERAPDHAPDPCPGTLGHGCPGPGGSTPPPLEGRPAAADLADRRGGRACVIGESPVALDLIRRLAARGVDVHAIVATADGGFEAREMGAVPHRPEVLPTLAPHLDVLISTDLQSFVDARPIARLCEHALLVDLAGPPGSVDFETAKKLGRAVIWKPVPAGGTIDAELSAAIDRHLGWGADGREKPPRPRWSR